MNKQNRNRLIDIGNKWMVARCKVSWGMSEKGEGIKKYILVVTV